MPKRRKRISTKDKEEIKEKIKNLFNLANKSFSKNKSLANRYVTLARKAAMKYRIRLPSKLKRQYCHHCYKYQMPGKNCTVRTTGKTITYTCKECKHHTRLKLCKS